MAELNIKFAIGVAALLLVIYLYSKYKQFAATPVGKSIGKILGAAAAVLTWIAGLPSWLLIGSLALYLMGPAVYKLATGAQTKQLAEDLNKLRDKISDEVAKGNLTEAEGEMISEALTAKTFLDAQSAASGQQGADAAIDAATSMRASAEAAIGQLDPEAQGRVEAAKNQIEEEISGEPAVAERARARARARV